MTGVIATLIGLGIILTALTFVWVLSVRRRDEDARPLRGQHRAAARN